MKENVSNLDEVFARKVTNILGKEPEVSVYVQGRLDIARDYALSLKPQENTVVITPEDTIKVSTWWEKHYKGLVNTAIAFSVVVVALPFGLNIQASPQRSMPSMTYVSADYDYFDEDYHQNAEEFELEYLEENDLI